MINLLKEERNQWLLIALASACLILLGVAVWLQAGEMEHISKRLDKLSEQLATVPVEPQPRVLPILPKKIGWINSCDAETRSISLGLCFDYPSHWILTPYEDEFRPQYKEFFLTSSRGRLLAAISSGGPAQAEEGVAFENGYDIRIVTTPLDEPEEFLGLGSKVAGYSSLYRPLNACEGAGCPIEHYFFQEDPNGRLFEILINYNGVPDDEVRANIDTILHSLRQGS